MSNERVSVLKLRRAIGTLPSDPPQIRPGKWYTTQKQHWLGWLDEYLGPGAYGRAPATRRDAEFAYNHIVEVEMLLWLVEAAGLRKSIVRRARSAARKVSLLQSKSAAVRRIAPWEVVAEALWRRS